MRAITKIKDISYKYELFSKYVQTKSITFNKISAITAILVASQYFLFIYTDNINMLVYMENPIDWDK